MCWRFKTMWAAVMVLRKEALDAEIISNRAVASDIYRLEVVEPLLAQETVPGQFLQVRIDTPGLFLRRPLGIAEADAPKGTIVMYYRVIGKGTAALARMKAGEVVNCLGPLGNGFLLAASRPLLIGGGMGLAPLLFLAQRFLGKAAVLIGGRNKAEVFWTDFFAPLTRHVFITTDDGSAGKKGFTTSLLPMLLQEYRFDALYVCGPEIMMKKIATIAAEKAVPCQVSLERRMACGLGACLSCVIDAKDGGRKKVCQDGPVFWAQEVFG